MKLPGYSAARSVVMMVSATALTAGIAKADDVDFSFFYDALSPHGTWVEVAGHGACWMPEVAEGWAPYTVGNWAYTDVGWTWVSHEPFGSIVFHYGRWLLTGDGWAWVPGSDWAPAWVSWRVGSEYVGWAPLPPEVPWHANRGVGSWVDVHSEIGPGYYRFCATRDFGAPRLNSVLLRSNKNSSVIFQTQNVTNITIFNNEVYCGGPQYRWLRERSSYKIPVLRVCREESPERFYSLNIGGNFGTVQNFISNDMLVLPAPRRVELNQDRRYRMAEGSATVSKGWSRDENSNNRLRAHLEGEWESRRDADVRQGGDARKPDVLVRPAAAEEKRAVLGRSEGGVVGGAGDAASGAGHRWIPGTSGGGGGSMGTGASSFERVPSGGRQTTPSGSVSSEFQRGTSGSQTQVPRALPVYPGRNVQTSSDTESRMSTPGIITERGVVPLERGVTIDRSNRSERGVSSLENNPQVSPRAQPSGAPVVPRAPVAPAESEPRQKTTRQNLPNVDPTSSSGSGFNSDSNPKLFRRDDRSISGDAGVAPKLRSLPNDSSGFVVPVPPSTPSTRPSDSSVRSVPTAPIAPSAPDVTSPNSTSIRSRSSVAPQSVPQTMPSSRASSSISPQPQETAPAPASPQSSGFGQRGGPSGSGRSSAPQGSATGQNAQSSGATLSSGTPAPAATSTPSTTKKKPGDPGYVPPQP
jgi:hypothetical protein